MNNSSGIQEFSYFEYDYWEYFGNISNILDLICASDLSSYSVVLWVTCIFTFLTCIAGIVGNGMVIWLLGFRMKKTPFTTYILNLAVADSGILISSIMAYIIVIIYLPRCHFPLWVFAMYATIYSLLYITDQLLLATISIDRCVAVLFPLWYRCHRPPHLSRIVCIFLWVLSSIITGLDFLLTFVYESRLFQFVLNVAICTPLMFISTLILFVKFCTKSHQRKRGKLLTAVSLALFFFLIFGTPMNYCYFVSHYYYFSEVINVKSLLSGQMSYATWLFIRFFVEYKAIIPMGIAFVCTVFNCSINPLIYFLVGRRKEGRFQLSMKFALQRVFKAEENHREQDRPTAKTPVLMNA